MYHPAATAENPKDNSNDEYIEIYNAESGQGIIAAILDLAPRYWFFTAKGSVDELQAHAADIQTYLKSMRLQ